MRVWAWVAIGAVVAALTVLGFPLIRMQTELRLANEEAVQARTRIAELESAVANLKIKLDASNQARQQLQGALDEANSDIEKRQFEVERLTTDLEKATKDAEPTSQDGDSAPAPSNGWRAQ